MLCSGRGGRKEKERRDGQGGVYIVRAARAQVEGQEQAQEGFPDGESEKRFPPWMTATLRRGGAFVQASEASPARVDHYQTHMDELLGLQSLSATAETALVFMAGVYLWYVFFCPNGPGSSDSPSSRH